MLFGYAFAVIAGFLLTAVRMLIAGGLMWAVLRARGAAVPVIFLSSRGEELDRVLGLDCFPSPGHARHHVCYLDADGTLYAGDAAGVRIQPSAFVLPPTPPPEVDLEAWERTLDEIEARRPERLALIHFGVADDVERHLGELRLRLREWADRVRDGASISGLKMTLGYGASTCSLADFIGTDLLVIFGSDLASNQPVTTKYMDYAKRAGTRIVVVNPAREHDLEHGRAPAVASKALFGTNLVDDFFQLRAGGAIGFINGVLKFLSLTERIDRSFVERHTTGFTGLAAALEGDAHHGGRGAAAGRHGEGRDPRHHRQGRRQWRGGPRHRAPRPLRIVHR